MVFTWNPAKSDLNLQERGFDFEFATLIFESVTVEKEDRRKDYGERRVVAVGLADGVPLTVVYTDRIGISARRSNRRERRAYRKKTRE